MGSFRHTDRDESSELDADEEDSDKNKLEQLSWDGVWCDEHTNACTTLIQAGVVVTGKEANGKMGHGVVDGANISLMLPPASSWSGRHEGKRNESVIQWTSGGTWILQPPNSNHPS